MIFSHTFNIKFVKVYYTLKNHSAQLKTIYHFSITNNTSFGNINTSKIIIAIINKFLSHKYISSQRILSILSDN